LLEEERKVHRWRVEPIPEFKGKTLRFAKAFLKRAGIPPSEWNDLLASSYSYELSSKTILKAWSISCIFADDNFPRIFTSL